MKFDLNLFSIFCEKIEVKFCAAEFFNEADTVVSSSILIYSQLQMGLYTPIGWQEATVVKRVS